MSALPKTKTAWIPVRFSAELQASMEAYCEERGMSKGEFYSEAVAWFLDWYEARGEEEAWRPRSAFSGVDGRAGVPETSRDALYEIVDRLHTKRVTAVTDAIRMYCEHVGIEPEAGSKRVTYDLSVEPGLSEQVQGVLSDASTSFRSLSSLFEHLVLEYAQWRLLEGERPSYWSSPTKSVGSKLSITFDESTYSKVQMLSYLDDVERGDVLYTALLRYLDGEL